MARLLIFDEAVRGVDVPFHPVVIGRSRKVDIPIRDALLSRKHCSIVPLDSGYRLVDLRSANGTYVNGARIDKADLGYDDVIEIGNTVLVFVDTQALSPGCELPALRNPQKARELIERVNKHSSVPVDLALLRCRIREVLAASVDQETGRARSDVDAGGPQRQCSG